MTDEEKPNYSESKITDVFKEFFNSFKIDGHYKYVLLIDNIIVDDSPIEIDYNELPNNLQKIISIYRKDILHYCVYRAIKEVSQVRIGSASEGLKSENRIKFKIVNYDRYSGILFEKPQELAGTAKVILDKDKDEKLSATVKIFNVGKTLIQKQWKSENDTEQVVIKVELDDKPHWIDIHSPTFEQMIRVKTQDVYGEIYSDGTYKSGIKNLHAYALLNGIVTKPVFNRTAFVDGVMYYDLQNTNGTIYKITKDGISKAEDEETVPIFLKSPSAKTSKSMQLEPEFDNPKALDEFVELCRIKEFDRIVFISHFIIGFLKGFPIPIRILHGEQGSAKTTISNAIKRIQDPEGENASSLPEKVDDVAIMLSKRDNLSYDNCDNFSKEISQFFCKAVSGTLYAKRGLYTNAEEFSLLLMSKISLNGIDPSINQPDLLERSIFYELPKIDKTKRITDNKFSENLEKLTPSVLGMVFQTIQKAMSIVDEVEKELDGSVLPRMATFSIWAEAISRVLGNKDNTFIERYWEMIDDSNLSLNEEYPLIPLIVDMMKKNCKLDENKKPIEYPKTATLDYLFTTLIGFENKDKGLPEDLKVLGKQLKKLTPILRTLGYEVVIIKNNKRPQKPGDIPRGSRVVTITPISDDGLDGY